MTTESRPKRELNEEEDRPERESRADVLDADSAESKAELKATARPCSVVQRG